MVAEETGKLLAHGTTTCLGFGPRENGANARANAALAAKKVSIST